MKKMQREEIIERQKLGGRRAEEGKGERSGENENERV